ncbi:MAG: minor capsid protein [bacterium]|nr:minor capsid protein [bacterium]
MPSATCTCGRPHAPLPVGALHLQAEALLLVRGSRALNAYATTQRQAIEKATAESLAKAGAYSDDLLTTSLKHLDQAAKSVKAEILGLGDLTQFAPDRQGGKLVQLTRLKALDKNLAATGAKLKQELTMAYQGMTKEMAKAGVGGTLAKLGVLKAGGYKALDQAGREALAEGAFSLFPADAFDFLSGYQLQLLGKLSDDLVAGIKGAVQVGIAQGEGPAKIARRIGGIVKNPDEFRQAGKTVFKTVQQRAELIARSETMRAYNQGALKFEAKLGVKSVFWLTAGDERMCPECEPLDGKEYPLTSLPSQPLHPACRCTHTPGAGDLSQITDLATLEAKIVSDTLGQVVVKEALQSGDYGKLTSAQLREVAKEKGVSIGRTKAERISLLSKASGQSEEWLSGHTMNELDAWFKQYKIGALKSKDELLAALYKTDHATDAAKLAALKQAEDAGKAAKQAAEDAAAKLAKANQAVADFHSGLAQLKALESDPAQFEAFHAQMDKLLAQVHGNLELLGPQQAADLGGYLSKAQDVFAFKVELNSQSVLREVLKAAKVKNFQWFTKPESVAYLTQKPLQPKIAEQVAAKVAAAKDAAKLKKAVPVPAPPAPAVPKPAPVAPKSAPAPKAAPMPTAAPVPTPAASPAVQARQADEAWEALKAKNPFTFHSDASELGGVHTKYFYTDQAGDKWLFKPISEDFRAWGDEVAYLIQREIDPDAIEVRFIELKDMHGRMRMGSIQQMKQGLKKPANYKGIDVTTIDPQDLVQLQREHVADWLISNHDGHAEQFLRAQDGRVYGIDKGQLYKYFGKDKLSVDYAPNAGGRFDEPIYNKLLRAHRDGKLKLDLQATGVWVRRVQGISDAAYREMLMPYAGRRFASQPGALEDFLKAATLRKNTLQADFERFYSEIESARTGKPVVFRFGDAAPAPAAATPAAKETGEAWARGSRINLKAEVETIRESGWQGRSLAVDKGDIEDQNILVRQVFGMDGEKQTILQLRLRQEADKRLVKLLKANVVGEVPKELAVEDGFWDTILAAAKTVNTHVGDLNYNTTKLRAAEDLRPALQKLAKAGSAVEQSMAQQYLKTLDDIAHAVEASTAGTPTKLPLVKQYAPSAAELKALQKGVGAPAKGKGLRVTASPRWTEDRVVSKGHELVVEAEHVPLSRFHSSIMDNLVEYHVDLGDGVEAVYKPFQGTGKSVGKSYAMHGRMTVKVREGVSESVVARAMERLKVLGLDTAPSTPWDEELMYLQKVAFVAKIDDSPAFLAAAEEAKKASTESAVRIWREVWSRHLGVKDVTKLPDYNPMGTHQAAVATGKGGTAGMRVQVRFDVSRETLEREMEGYVLMHGMTKGSVEDFLEAVLPTNQSFIPTAERFSTGVPIGGMSPSQDMNSGGASYFFTRIMRSTNTQANTIRFKPDLLRRADAISYNSDHYGKVVGNFVRENRISDLETLKKMPHYCGNETIIKGAVPLLENMDSIVVGDAGRRVKVIALFKKHGITVLPDGRRIEDVVFAR